MAGPLAGYRVIEIAGIGPGPFAAMVLADHGAEVIRIERPGTPHDPYGTMTRSRRSIGLDLKAPEGAAILRALAKTADALIEGFRPGVMERLGLGPDLLCADNPGLVYGRLTGYGQSGPYAKAAGHDIDYIALAGVLHAVGRTGDRPVPPINLLGDFGGGGLLMAFGIASALLARHTTGRGQVIDCAIVDGAALFMTMVYDLFGQGAWRDKRGVNLLDTGAPFYDVYETLDREFIAVGAIEPQFYAALRCLTGLDADPAFEAQMDRAQWPLMRQKLQAVFRTKTRTEWCRLADRADVCLAPVLSLEEAPGHGHSQARASFVKVGDLLEPAPAPRYSATPCDRPAPKARFGPAFETLAAQIGYDAAALTRLREANVLDY